MAPARGETGVAATMVATQHAQLAVARVMGRIEALYAHERQSPVEIRLNFRELCQELPSCGNLLGINVLGFGSRLGAGGRSQGLVARFARYSSTRQTAT